MFFYFKLGAVIWGKDGIKWFGEFFDNIPIPKAADTQSKFIINKVTQILTLKKEDHKADTTALEAEIDAMVYELYELTEEEIKIVEEGVK